MSISFDSGSPSGVPERSAIIYPLSRPVREIRIEVGRKNLFSKAWKIPAGRGKTCSPDHEGTFQSLYPFFRHGRRWEAGFEGTGLEYLDQKAISIKYLSIGQPTIYMGILKAVGQRRPSSPQAGFGGGSESGGFFREVGLEPGAGRRVSKPAWSYRCSPCCRSWRGESWYCFLKTREK
jgi:hypothetical protein